MTLCFLITGETGNNSVYAQAILLSVPGAIVNLSPAFEPVLIKGLRVHPENPFLFDFIIDTGNTQLTADNPQLKVESNKLIKYFLAAMTVPEKDLWVNLSPYEKDRMIAPTLGETQMGYDMLAQDYVLKQLTASLIYPESNLGKTFWDEVYAKSQQLYGTTQIRINTFNKVWIVADRADVFERGNVAYVVGTHLNVMLEEDYLSLSRHFQQNKFHTIVSQVIRKIILPQLEKEVNVGKNFSSLRQIFYSMILASWYKMALKDAILTQIYGNKSKVTVGINQPDAKANDEIFKRYLRAYKKGVFNYIKEDDRSNSIGFPPGGGQPIVRKYFSGGEDFAVLSQGVIHEHSTLLPGESLPKHAFMARVAVNFERFDDAAMIYNEQFESIESIMFDHDFSFGQEDWKEEHLREQYKAISNWISKSPYGVYKRKVRRYEVGIYNKRYKSDKNRKFYSRLWTVRHEMSVAVHAYMIARAMNLDPDYILKIVIAAAIHDIGKTQIGYGILNYPGKLEESKMQKMRTHMDVEEILKRFNIPPDICEMISQHHERENGKGYPKGLSAEEITLGGKILAVADVFSALREARPYRPFGLTIGGALGIIESKEGEYDAKVLDALKSVSGRMKEKSFAEDTVREINQYPVISNLVIPRRRDHAMAANGGIDMTRNQVNVFKQGQGIQMRFDSSMIRSIKRQGFDGVVFRIQFIVPITNPLLLSGSKSGNEVGINVKNRVLSFS